MKKSLSIFVIMFCVAITHISAQIISVSEIYHCESKYRFESQWKYLTTELYLMNMDKSDAMLKYVLKPAEIKNMKSMFISAEVRGSIIDGVEFPLYNFHRTKKESQADMYDGITVLKNVELNDDDEMISAKITVDIITNGSNRLQNFIQNCTKYISAISPNLPKMCATTLNNLKEDLYKLALDDNYVFSSTIKLYEDASDRKIHSIRVYLFVPTGYPRGKYTFNLNEIVKERKVDNAVLSSAIQGLPFPYIVAVNYLASKNSESRKSFFNDTYHPKEEYQEEYQEDNNSGTGTIQIAHDSTNPYDVYIDGEWVGKLSSKGVFRFSVTTGNHQVRVVQSSGYLMYPTQGTTSVYVKSKQTVELSGPRFNGRDYF